LRAASLEGVDWHIAGQQFDADVIEERTSLFRGDENPVRKRP